MGTMIHMIPMQGHQFAADCNMYLISDCSVVSYTGSHDDTVHICSYKVGQCSYKVGHQ